MTCRRRQKDLRVSVDSSDVCSMHNLARVTTS